MNSRVCVVILNYNTYDLTLNIVERLQRLSYDNLSILVIDNDSPNESGKVLLERSSIDNFIFIRNKQNDGYAKGNNIGLQYSIDNGYEYTLIMNNDIIINDNDIIEKLIGSFISDDIICVGPKIVDTESVPCAPYIKRPSWFDLSLGISFYNKQRKKSVDENKIAYRLHGCFMFFKNKLLKNTGLFDERTFLYCEEEIFAERIIKNEYKNYYNSDIQIVHMESSTVGSNRWFKSKFKRKCVKKSLKLYLNEYRKFNWLQRLLVIRTRMMIIFLRG